MLKGNGLKKTDITLCQNLFDSDKALSNYQEKLLWLRYKRNKE